MPVPECGKGPFGLFGNDAGRLLRRGFHRGHCHLRGVDLHRTGLGVDRALVTRRPVVGIVVLVGPEQQVDISGLGLEHDRPVRLVDPQRPHFRVPSAGDLLVVEAGRIRVGLKLLDHRPHARLLRTGEPGKRLQKIERHR